MIMKSLNVDSDIAKKIEQHAIKRKLKRGEILYRQGDMPHALFILEKGLIGLVKTTESGNESLLRIFSDRDFFGHTSLLMQTPYYATSVVLKDSILLEVPCDRIERSLITNFGFIRAIAARLAQDLKVAEARLVDFTDKNVKIRIVEALIYLKNRYPDYTWTRKEIGEFAGATTETVTRVLTKLEEKGLIKKEGREILIPNPKKLLNL